MKKKWVIRSLIVIFWIALIFGVLYFPEWSFLRESRSINIFTWGDILEPTVISDFEKETGIKVNMNFYASNEEMVVKLKATGGKGYDLIIPSDYSVALLAKEGLLKRLDKSKLHFLSQLSPKLLNQQFDPNNLYSLPFAWEIILLGIDQDYFAHRPFQPSLKAIFDESLMTYQMTMSNDPVQMLWLASFYLYGSIGTISDEQLAQVTTLLSQQKKHVNAYADFRADYFLATRNSSVVLCYSSYLWRTMKKFPFVGYVIPQEGTFISIENFAIPLISKKEDLSYELMNYLYRRSSMKKHYETYGIFPATVDVLQDLEVDPSIHNLLSLSSENFQRLYFTVPIASQEKIRDAWIRIKTDYR